MKIIICGKSGSGKDFLRKKFQSKGLGYATPYTTRPIRTNEVSGVDYNFVDKKTFLKNQNSIFVEGNFFGWYYGITKDQWNYFDIFVQNTVN